MSGGDVAHEIDVIDGDDSSGFYVEGHSRECGWFCFEIEAGRDASARVRKELRDLGFSNPAISATLADKREARIVRAVNRRAADYRLQAARKLVAAGLDGEGDLMDADEVPIAPIASEHPGAWVPVYVWVPARELPPKGPRR